MTSPQHAVELAERPPAVLEHLEQAAETWGGGFELADTPAGEGASTVVGRLGLPVMAGLRRGWVIGAVELTPEGEGTRLVFRVEESAYRVERGSVAMLVLAAAGAVALLVAPFFPALWRLAPLAVLMALASWFFIVARLRNSGPDEFFGMLAEELAGDAGSADR